MVKDTTSDQNFRAMSRQYALCHSKLTRHTCTSRMSAALMVSSAATAALSAGMASSRISSHSCLIDLASCALTSACAKRSSPSTHGQNAC
eukprot:349632-Chlamydomonas_euryale.AAC.16